MFEWFYESHLWNSFVEIFEKSKTCFNPILTQALGGMLLHEGEHFVPTISSNLYNMANMTLRWQDMVSKKNFGLYLVIDTKHNLF